MSTKMKDLPLFYATAIGDEELIAYLRAQHTDSVLGFSLGELELLA